MKNKFIKKNNSSIKGGSGPGISFYVLLIIVLTCFHISLSHAQSLTPLSGKSELGDTIKLPDERVFMKTDRELYLCGEKIYFSAFTCEGKWFIPVSISSVLYVEFYNQDNRVLIKGKFALDRGRGSGFISIPKTISTDFYYIRAYTNYMKNFGAQQFFFQRLKIVNPFTFTSADFSTSNDSSALKKQEDTGMKSAPGLSPATVMERGLSYSQPDSFRLKITSAKEKYKNREEAKVFIVATGHDGKPVSVDLTVQVCLSVSPKTEDISFFENLGMSRQLTKVELKYLPETRGDIISGRLVYKNDKPASGIEILQSFTGKSSWIESSVSDSDGDFYFQTGNEKNLGDLIFKIQNSEREVSIIPDEEFFMDFMPPHKDHFQLTKDEIALLAKFFINIQVDDAFSAEKNNRSRIDDLPPAFYGKDFVDYRLSEYAKLPNMKEFIFEVIKGLILSRENKQDVINIIDEISFRKIGMNPLMLIDGVPVSESSVIISLNPEKIASIRVVRDKYYYKNQAFDGILDIITSKGDAQLFDLPKNTFRYNFIHAQKGESIAGDGPAQGPEDKIPFYKNLVYWNPNVKTDEEGKAIISFTAPDNSGIFTIQCYGITTEGVPGEGKAQITIGENRLK